MTDQKTASEGGQDVLFCSVHRFRLQEGGILRKFEVVTIDRWAILVGLG